MSVNTMANGRPAASGDYWAAYGCGAHHEEKPGGVGESHVRSLTLWHGPTAWTWVTNLMAVTAETAKRRSPMPPFRHYRHVRH